MGADLDAAAGEGAEGLPLSFVPSGKSLRLLLSRVVGGFSGFDFTLTAKPLHQKRYRYSADQGDAVENVGHPEIRAGELKALDTRSEQADCEECAPNIEAARLELGRPEESRGKGR